MLSLTTSTYAQVRVKTLGGGRIDARGSDAGFIDGNTLQSSQFNTPSGLAVDPVGNVYLADRKNGALRKLDVTGNRSSTLLTALNDPVAVAFDSTNNIYVLTQGDGAVRRVDSFGALANIATGLTQPTALAADSTNLYVTEATGRIAKIDLHSLRVTRLSEGLNQPGGIAVLESGLLAVSETGAHQIRLIDPVTGRTIQQIGTGLAGFRNGASSIAQFNRPQHIARAPNGTLIVADRGNQRVRLINPDGNVTTLYGVDPALWEGPECLTCTPIILPGWLDGAAEFAEAREPVGVTVSRDGKVYTTEVFYHLVREVTGASLMGGSTPGGPGPSIIPQPPAIIPESGYFPLGQNITVLNPNTNAFFSTAIYYTTDGSNPTTNSTRLVLDGGTGTIPWRETMRDLTSLKLVAIVGGAASEVTTGKPSTRTEIGITRDLTAGPGSTLVLPVTVNLRPVDRLQSLQYRVEVAPLNNTPPVISGQFRALSISTNDFIRVVTSTQVDKPAMFSVASYTNGAARGLAITFIGTTANLSVENFATVGMLALPIPPNALPGATYAVSVLAPSGTSDGAEAAVPIALMPARQITVAETGYLVGDSSPATWYNADAIRAENGISEFGPYGFGDRRLNNNDVNNAFAASLGLRIPYPFSDLFDAMDAFPEDSGIGVGGDGLIRFLDWQVVLRRSLGLDAVQWERRWIRGGERIAMKSARLANLSASMLVQTSGEVWHAQAAVAASDIENAEPGGIVNIPVSVSVLSGYQVGGLAFRATLQGNDSSPAVLEPIQFVAASGRTAPMQSPGPANHILLCGWPLVPAPSFSPALQGQALLGYVRARVPANAQRGQSYTLRFANADGSPDLRTQYDFETRSATVWVQTSAQRSPEIISDEWKQHFFGGTTDAAAQSSADPDGDGISNVTEYLSGTNPTDAQSYLRLATPSFDRSKGGVVLRWSAARGKLYTIESRTDLSQLNWTVLATDILGSGAMQEWVHRDPGAARFYRIRLQTQSPQSQ